jgi:hypothetical protein
MKRNVVEILYTDACPFWKTTLQTINEVLKELNIAVPVKETRIATLEEAKRYRFPGSPTVRINGVDIDPAAKQTVGFIGCRIYTHNGRIYEYPTKQMIKTALKQLTEK